MISFSAWLFSNGTLRFVRNPGVFFVLYKHLSSIFFTFFWICTVLSFLEGGLEETDFLQFFSLLRDQTSF